MRSGWKEVTLGDIYDISSSKRVLQKQWQSEGVPFYRAREIVKLSQFGKVENELFISEELFEEFKDKYGAPEPGDLMVSAVGTLGACYVVQPGDRFYYKDASVLRFSPKASVDSRYIQRAFGTTHIIDQINSGSGSTVGTYTISRAQKTTLPLPPFAEQKRIAAILDAADALRDKRRESLAQIDTLLQSIFLDMFGDPVANPKGWKLCSVGDVVHSASDGPHVSPKYSEKGIPFLSTRHIKPGEVVWEDLKYIDQEEAELQWKKCKPEPGDILYTKGGTTGIAARVVTSEPFAIWVHVALLKPIMEKVHPAWLEGMLNSSYCYTQSQRYTHGIANRDLGLKRMVKINMYLPPLDLQRRFAAIVESVEQQKGRLREHLAELDTLFASLQQRAFNGDL